MGGFVAKDKFISRAQYLDLVYFESSTLYGLIPNSRHPSNDPSKLAPESHANGMVGTTTAQSATSSISKQG